MSKKLCDIYCVEIELSFVLGRRVESLVNIYVQLGVAAVGAYGIFVLSGVEIQA